MNKVKFQEHWIDGGGGVNGYDINGGPSSFFYLNGVQMFEKRRTRRHTYYPYIETRTFSLSF
jgi:hypothetical protein